MEMIFRFYDDVRLQVERIFHGPTDDRRAIFGSYSDLRAGFRGKKKMNKYLNHDEELHFFRDAA